MRFWEVALKRICKILALTGYSRDVAEWGLGEVR